MLSKYDDRVQGGKYDGANLFTHASYFIIGIKGVIYSCVFSHLIRHLLLIKALDIFFTSATSLYSAIKASPPAPIKLTNPHGISTLEDALP